MSLNGINLYSPQTMSEALFLLTKLKKARVIAGGTDLLVDIKEGRSEAGELVSLQKIQELKAVKKDGRRVSIGALVTPQEIIKSSLINEFFPALADAARSMASPQIRAMATIGGNIASSVPSADLPPPLIAAEAILELCCSSSSREIPLSEFFIGPRKSSCKKNEVLAYISIPLPLPRTGIAFQKFSLREANALAVASVAARLSLNRGKIAEAAIVLGAVAPTPLLAEKASEFLCGSEPSDALFEKAALLAQEESRPISDLRGSLWYRKELIRVLTRRALAEALKRAQGRYRRGKHSR